jgi:hypothetical protein
VKCCYNKLKHITKRNSSVLMHICIHRGLQVFSIDTR